MRGSRRQQMKNPHAEADQFQRRAAVGFLGIAIAMIGLSIGYFRLQVLQHEEYQTRAEGNRIKPRPIVPARGLIYDRNGELIADNVPAYRLEVVPEDVPDLKATLAGLRELVAISDDDIAQFNETRRATRGFRPVALKLRLSEEERARVAVNRFRFPGVDVVPYLTRRYPDNELFSHVIGYVGRLDARDLEALGDSKYAVLSHVGKSGIERSYEDKLRGEIGYENVEQNVEGRVRRVVNREPAKPGADLQLSIDANLQRAAIAAFGELEGAAVAVDPRTGEVLAMVSLPMFDPNLFVNGISHADYNRLMKDPAAPLFDRNLHGGTLPGSTIKPLVALAGLESGLRRAEDKTLSTGEFRLPGVSRGFRDSHAGGHGWVDVRESIAQSVNTYYYKLAMDMGIVRFDDYMRKYGFGAPTGIDLIGESSGILPSPEWKRKRFKQEWFLGETINSGIGQGYWVTTPLQLAQGTASLADNGLRRRLHLVKSTRHGFQEAWQPTPQPPGVLISNNPAHLQAVKDGMIGTIYGARGTARAIGVGAPYLIAGKTGTAQRKSRVGNISLNPHNLPLNQRHQALFIGYAPADKPTIAVAVVVEHGGYGATSAAPIARKIMDAWLVKAAPDTATPDLVPGKQPVAPVPAPAVPPVAADDGVEP